MQKHPPIARWVVEYESRSHSRNFLLYTICNAINAAAHANPIRYIADTPNGTCSACNRSAKSCAPAISSYNPSRKKARQLKHSTQRKIFNRILAVFLLIFKIPFPVTRYTLIIAKNDLFVKSYFKLVPAVFQERPYNESHPPLCGPPSPAERACVAHPAL